MNIEDIYTSLSEAKEEIERRWNDVELRKKVEEFLGGDMNHKFENNIKALYFRVILTPNFETRYFNDVANLADLNPLCLELSSDKFCSHNKDKVHLGKLVFSYENPKNKQRVITKRNIIDFHKSENKILKEIDTINLKKFIDVHHHLYFIECKKMMDILDISYLKEKSYNIKEIYKKVFAFCIVKGILFENFIIKEKENEKKFVESIIIPAFEEVSQYFNLKPLIVPLLPLKDEEKEYWIHYPISLEREIINLGL